MNKPRVPDVERVLRKYGDALSPESIASSGYPDDVRRALSQAAAGDDAYAKLWAVVLRAGVPAGFLSSVIADDSPLADPIARALGVERAGLLASEEEARLFRTDEGLPPTLVYTSRLRDDAAGILPAVRAAFVGDAVFLGPDNVMTQAVPGIGATEWRCYFACALCAALLVDPVPADEIPACVACLQFCSSS
ncbi:hypothetical protein ABGB17_37755 [Sphaerisporangium sp. B11E5]|uniref:hypothetical protein n=1 Tax=Sphaerisporangium sp. B11E5 TaxID=3153563 RepID=UPI00325F6D65